MSKKINELDTIDEAKNAEYNSEKLTRDEDKNIFNNKLLETNGVIDKTKLCQTAQLLEKALRAEKATIKNGTLLSQLKTAKTNNGVDYQVANSQVDKGITKLESFSNDTSGLSDGKTSEQWRILGDEYESKQLEYKRNAEKKQKEIDKYVKEVATVNQLKLDEATVLVTNIDNVIQAIKVDGQSSTSGAGGSLLTGISQRNVEYYTKTWLAIENDPKCFVLETNISYQGRKFLTPNKLTYIAYQFADIFRQVDKTKLFATIDSELDSANATIAKTAFESFIKCSWGWFVPKNGSGGMFQPLESCEEGVLVGSLEEHNAVEANWPEKKVFKNDQWPTKHFKLKDFFDFMTRVFPASGLLGNKLIKTDNNLRLMGRNGEEILTNDDKSLKTFKVKWSGGSMAERIEKEKVLLEIDLSLGDVNGAFKWFWEAFSDPDWYRESSVETDKINLEVNEGLSLLRLSENYRDIVKYVNRVKSIVGTDIWNDEWENVSFNVGESYLNTSNSIVSKGMQKVTKEIARQTKDLVKTNFFLATFPESSNLRGFDKFKSEAYAKRSLANVNVNVDTKKIEKLTDELSTLKANQNQAMIDRDDAIWRVEKLAGTTLEQLKVAFDDIYRSGPSSNNLYTQQQLERMVFLLGEIKKKEPGNELNNTYEEYKKKLKEGVDDKIDDLYKLTYTWIILGDSLEIRIAKSGFRDDVERDKKLGELKIALEKISNFRKLTDQESNELRLINKKIGTKDENVSDLTKEKLLTILGLSATFAEADLKLSEWQATKNFEEEVKIEELVKAYRPNSTESVKVDQFKENLEHATRWEGGKTGKISGDDYWETFVKKGPRFIIGAIKRFDYEKSYGEFADAAKKTEVDTALAAANSYENSDKTKVAKKTNLWNKDSARDMAKFLYKWATGETGEKLVKELETTLQAPQAPQSPNNTNDEKKWEGNWLTGGFSGNYRPWVTYLGGAALVIGVLLLIFWKNIKEWWDGPAEEQGKVGDTDEKEENEE